jgi:hypothetical protein
MQNEEKDQELRSECKSFHTLKTRRNSEKTLEALCDGTLAGLQHGMLQLVRINGRKKVFLNESLHESINEWMAYRVQKERFDSMK